MIRWVFLLAVGLGLTLAVMGQDRGQRRLGLVAAPAVAKVAAPVVEDTPAPIAVFLPVTPKLIVAPVAPVVATITPAVPAPVLALVALQRVSLRAGPGRNFAVVANVRTGDRVRVMADDDAGSGWRHVRLLDGTMGYVAARMLAPAP